MDSNDVFLNTIVENGADFISILDADGRYKYQSPSFQKALGYPKTDCKDFSAFDLIHPEDRLKFTEAFKKLLQNKHLQMPLLRFKDHSGNWRWIQSTATNMLNHSTISGIIFNSIEVPEATQPEVSEKTNTDYFHVFSSLASKTKCGVLITNPHCCIEWVNESFSTITGYTLSQISGKTPQEVLYGENTSKETAHLIAEYIKAKKQFSQEILNYNAKGDEIWLSIEYIPITDQNDDLSKVIFLYTDITEKKKSESELVKLTKYLTKQNSNLQQFTYIVSHNLRAPLASAMGIAELIKVLGPSDAFYKEGLGLLEYSLINLDDVITDINKVLSVQNNLEQFEEINLFSLVCDVLSSLQKQIDEEDADVQIAIDKDFMLSSINAYLHSVIHNLISNSIKYKSPDRKLKIKVSAIKRGTENLIFVSDNGIGIDLKKHKDQLFRLYKRLTPHIEGKGLGLYLVKTQVEELGGKIDVESILNMGTSFIIRLPEHL